MSHDCMPHESLLRRRGSDRDTVVVISELAISDYAIFTARVLNSAAVQNYSHPLLALARSAKILAIGSLFRLNRPDTHDAIPVLSRIEAER